MESDGVGSNDLGEETDEGKLIRVWGVGGGFITQSPHEDIKWGNHATDMGSGHWWGRNYHILGDLPKDYEVGWVTSSGMYGNFPQHRSDPVTFHVRIFSIECCSAKGREGYSD